eukprot:7589002-Pyramimonas_sp.AAC.1
MWIFATHRLRNIPKGMRHLSVTGLLMATSRAGTTPEKEFGKARDGTIAIALAGCRHVTCA